MAQWFLRGLRRGIVTTDYPRTDPDRWTSALPTPPVINGAVLDAEVADILAAVCPSGALRREQHILTYDVGACTACGRCLAVEPQVVRPSGVFELATHDRSHLIKHIPLRKSSKRGRV